VFVAFRPPSDTLGALAMQIADGRYVVSDSSVPPAPKALPS
jgi:hypothetical protein